MKATKIHHINFVVQDLEEAMPRFSKQLGLGVFEVVDHAARGAHVARTKIGDAWLVLVAPYDADSVPGQHLAEHGEGFFLLSLCVDDEQDWRDGILDWQVADAGTIHGAEFQFTRGTG
ncbi:MAG: VOC family protein [Gammaproteobacteria bacterium]|nr:VOC family protein [Gammaproteobacteria bacterium]